MAVEEKPFDSRLHLRSLKLKIMSPTIIHRKINILGFKGIDTDVKVGPKYGFDTC